MEQNRAEQRGNRGEIAHRPSYPWKFGASEIIENRPILRSIGLLLKKVMNEKGWAFLNLKIALLMQHPSFVIQNPSFLA